jgi:threonine synthase
LERLLYFLSGDTALVAELMGKLNGEGYYTVPESLQQAINKAFWAACCSDKEAKQTIAQVWNQHGYLCDTHTAVAWAVAEEYVRQTADTAPMVVLSTASAYKFPEAVLSSLEQTDATDEFYLMQRLHEKTGVPIPKNLVGLQEKQPRHTDVIAKDKMLSYVMNI